MSADVKIALLGYGVVGQGVADILARENLGFDVAHIVVGDASKPRDIVVPGVTPTTDVEAALADPDVKVVVEVNGEVDRNRTLLADAMRAGKHVVTANKALLSAHFEELTSIARECGVQLRYEAAVAGGIPVIAQVQALTPVSPIRRVEGIMNGSCNWLLSTMAERRQEMSELIPEAQALGFLEADPSADVDGLDARRKLRILATLAFGRPVLESDVACAPITTVTLADIDAAAADGKVIKQMARAVVDGDTVTASVGPALVPADSLWSKVNGATNAVQLGVDYVEDVTLIGQGAGRYPTAHAVVSDLVALGL